MMTLDTFQQVAETLLKCYAVYWFVYFAVFSLHGLTAFEVQNIARAVKSYPPALRILWVVLVPAAWPLFCAFNIAKGANDEH